MSDSNNCQSIQIFLDTEIIGATGSSLGNWVGVSSRQLCVHVASLIHRKAPGPWNVVSQYHMFQERSKAKKKKMDSRLSFGRASCKWGVGGDTSI